MRPTTAPETILRSICRRLRAEGARMSVIVASETNGLAVGSWPGVCEEIGLVLIGEEGRIQVQAGVGWEASS
jgi:hypothetical protein